MWNLKLLNFNKISSIQATFKREKVFFPPLPFYNQHHHRWFDFLTRCRHSSRKFFSQEKLFCIKTNYDFCCCWHECGSKYNINNNGKLQITNSSDFKIKIIRSGNEMTSIDWNITSSRSRKVNHVFGAFRLQLQVTCHGWWFDVWTEHWTSPSIEFFHLFWLVNSTPQSSRLYCTWHQW